MKVAFRVDASSNIGTGHFMRCLTLADALKQRGAAIRFVCRSLPEHLQDMLIKNGHHLSMLNSGLSEPVQEGLAHAHWLGTNQQADAQDSIQELSDQTWDWLVVDHYALDARWESELRCIATNIMAIDDIADRQHDCDVLLDQNYYADMRKRYVGKVPEHCRLLLGPRYALLRDEFKRLREQVKPRNDPVKRVLVFFGGMDAKDFTSRAIEALTDPDMDDLKVDVVIGAQHPRRKHIESTCAKHGFSCHVQTERMADLIAAADLSIGAGGSAIWERCCLGLPAFVISTADNQIKQVADAASDGFIYAPQLRWDLREAIKRHLIALLENNNLRNAISSRAMQVVDGRGVLRVIGIIGGSGISIVAACQDDIERLFEWRNNEGIRAVSCNKDMISWEDHQSWFASVLSSNDRIVLIGKRESMPLGVIRFDIQDHNAEVSIYLVPGVTEAGAGTNLLWAAERWLMENRPEITKLHAKVLGDNERSHRLFLGSDYQVDSACYSKRLQ